MTTKVFQPGQTVWVQSVDLAWRPGVYIALNPFRKITMQCKHEVQVNGSRFQRYFRDADIMSEEDYAKMALTT